MCHDPLHNLINLYGKIMTADLESNNQQMIKPIDLYLKIDEYFDRID